MPVTVCAADLSEAGFDDGDVTSIRFRAQMAFASIMVALTRLDALMDDDNLVPSPQSVEGWEYPVGYGAEGIPLARRPSKSRASTSAPR